MPSPSTASSPPLRGQIASTGGWDHYALVSSGRSRCRRAGRIAFRPDAPVKGALLDLRALYLVPAGTQPKVERPDRPSTPADIAKSILDEKLPRDLREQLVKRAVPDAAAVIRAMTAELTANDAREEYRRIPWIWRVAIAAGRANEGKVLTELLDAALPKKGEPLADWQAVVLGGGVINGLSLEGKWPGERIAELVRDNPELERRWADTLKLAHTMADNEKTAAGTRYDALRIVALDDWTRAEPRLAKHLSRSAHAELQQGAVSGLVDVKDSGCDRAAREVAARIDRQ